MIKKILVLTALTSFSGIALANGFYVGNAYSVDQSSIKNEVTYPLSSSIATTQQSNLALTTVSMHFIAGYKYLRVNSPWGFEGNVDFRLTHGHNTFSIINWFNKQNASLTYTSPKAVNFSILARYTMQRNMVVFIGPTFSIGQFKINPGATAGDLGVSKAESANLNGYGATVGIDFPINHHFSLATSYRIIQYNKVTWEAVEPLSGEKVRQSITPRTQSVQVGLIYNL